MNKIPSPSFFKNEQLPVGQRDQVPAVPTNLPSVPGVTDVVGREKHGLTSALDVGGATRKKQKKKYRRAVNLQEIMPTRRNTRQQEIDGFVKEINSAIAKIEESFLKFNISTGSIKKMNAWLIKF